MRCTRARAKNALKELGLEHAGEWRCGEDRFDMKEHKLTETLVIFDTEVETIEIKSGQAYLPPH